MGMTRERIERAFTDAWREHNFQRLRQASLAEDVRGTVCEKCIAYNDD